MRHIRIASVVALLAAAPLAAQQPVLMPANTFHGGLLGLAVYDPQVAIAVGADGMILRTQDGGVNWWHIPVAQLGVANQLEDATFVGVTVFAVGEMGTILRSDDGGVNWRVVFASAMTGLSAVHFGDALHGVIVGDSGVALFTQDGGTTWTRSQTGVLANLVDVRMSGPTAGTAVGTQGTILRTDDGGRSWRRQGTLASQYMTGVYMNSPTSAVAAGLNGVGYYTTDGGANWMPANLGTSMSMSDIVQAPGGMFYSAGSTATIIRSADGGRNWQRAFQGNGFAFEDVDFADARNGWAIGNNGVIMHTTDGGMTWLHQMGVPAAPVAAASTPTLVPTGGSLYLEILGITIAAPAGPGMWRASVSTASNGNRLDQLSGTAPNGDLYAVSLVYTTSRTCPEFLASLISQGGQMRTAPAYIPPGWFQVSVEKDNVTAYVCLPMGNGNLIGGVTTPAIARVDPPTVRPALASIGNAALLRWGNPRN